MEVFVKYCTGHTLTKIIFFVVYLIFKFNWASYISSSSIYDKIQ